MAPLGIRGCPCSPGPAVLCVEVTVRQEEQQLWGHSSAAPYGQKRRRLPGPLFRSPVKPFPVWIYCAAAGQSAVAGSAQGAFSGSATHPWLGNASEGPVSRCRQPGLERGWLTPLTACPTTGLNHQALWLRASELLFFGGDPKGSEGLSGSLDWMECGPALTASRTFY